MEYDRVEVVREKKSEEGCIKIPEDRLVELKGETHIFLDPYIAIPVSGTEFNGKAIYLTPTYDWILGMTSRGALLCIPLKKEEDQNV